MKNYVTFSDQDFTDLLNRIDKSIPGSNAVIRHSLTNLYAEAKALRATVSAQADMIQELRKPKSDRTQEFCARLEALLTEALDAGVDPDWLYDAVDARLSPADEEGE